MISAYFPQILKKEIIALPRLGTLNLHPGWLPSFQGAMVYFWALKQGVPRAGVSLHWIDEGIDTGDLIERKSFAIHNGMTQEQVLVKTAFIGSQLIKRVGKELRQRKTIKSLACTEPSHYFPLPNQSATEAYLKKHRFFRLRDLFGILNRPR
jgi:methionyl-tRNA formyltransferase